MATLKYWLWLTTREGLALTGTLRALEHFGTPERAYYAEPEEYDEVEGLPSKAKAALKNKGMEEADRILGECDRLGLDIMTIQDADYPERLRQIDDPPPLLYIRGRRILFDDEVTVGVVGARECSDYGIRMAGKLGLELAMGGALVVSGMAQGADTAAIKGALRGGGTVVSVLAGGVDIPYPHENRFLYEDVAAVGALISEYPPGTPHRGEQFPVRNRIISGLSLGVAVPECKIHSGSMITVRRAIDQNRDVFAVPGNVDAPMSRGPNLLIQQGAKLVTCGGDILEEYRSLFPVKLAHAAEVYQEDVAERLTETESPRRKKARNEAAPEAPKKERIGAAEQKNRFTDDQIALLQALGQGSRSADELVELTQIPARRVSTALTMLQVEGVVEETAGRRFTATVELDAI